MMSRLSHFDGPQERLEAVYQLQEIDKKHKQFIVAHPHNGTEQCLRQDLDLGG